jgi:murein DD-endopeptidase MepM/ murein hydrolase activator NlpD
VPEAWLVAGGDGPLEVVAPAGTPVHVVEGGTVRAVTPTPDGVAVTVRAADEAEYRYDGLAHSPLSVGPGDDVEAGQILGALAARGGGALPHLRLELRDGSGAPADLYQLLLGLPDPTELGYAADGLGVEIDPDAGDRALAGDPAP